MEKIIGLKNVGSTSRVTRRDILRITGMDNLDFAALVDASEVRQGLGQLQQKVNELCFKVEYGVTPYNDVLEAYNNSNKLIICIIEDGGGRMSEPYYLNYFDKENSIFHFGSFNAGQVSWQVFTLTQAGYSNISSNPIQSRLTFDNAPTANSNNPVKSSGIKTALDAKQDTLVSGTNIKTINGQSVLGSGNLDVKDIFVAEYGVTTYEQLSNAYNAGKYLVIKYTPVLQPNNSRFLLLGHVVIRTDGALAGTYGFIFTTIENNSYMTCVVDRSGQMQWTTNLQVELVSGTNIKTINNTSVLGTGNLTLENSSNKTNDIANNDADTTKYPSCKGVADYVSGIVGSINTILDTI